MRIACIFAVCGTVCALAPAALSQAQPEVRIRGGPYAPPGAVISVEANLVEMTATVRDARGRLAGGFQRDDFELFDNGKPREITVFTEQRAARPNVVAAPRAAATPASPAPSAAPAAAPGPRSIALFFDDTHITEFGLNKAKTAARKLAASGLRPGDRMAVYTDSGNVVLDLTDDRDALARAIDRVMVHPQRGATGVAVCPTLTPYQAYVITEHLDSIALNIAVAEKIGCDCHTDDPECPRLQPALVQSIAAGTWYAFRYQSTVPLDVLKIVMRALSRAPGERILLMVSPGFVTGGMERQKGALTDEALRAHVVINALDAEGLPGYGETPDAKAPGHAGWVERTQALRQSVLTKLMKDAAAATGGQFLANTNDIGGALEKLAEPPEISYLIGFSPPGEPDDRYHPLRLRLKNKPGYQVASRPGYFATPPGKRQESAQERIDRMADSRETASPFPAALRVSAPRASTLRVDISVDARSLKFPRKQGRNVQEITFVTLLEDATGNFIAGKQSVMDMALTGATLAALQKNGIHAETSFFAPKGSYRVREIVREVVDNRIAAVNGSFQAK